MSVIATAFVALMPQLDSKFGSSVERQAGSQVDSAGKNTGRRFGTALAVGAAAIGAGVALVAPLIKSASDAQQSLGATETVFGKFADSVVSNSERAADKFGLSANEYRESANLIGSLFKNQGVELDQLAGKTDNMIGVASDLAATFGGPTSDAVEALGSAFKGEFDPLEKFGISLKESSVSALLAARGQEDLTGASLATAKQVAITDLIMRQSKDSLGAFGRESDTLAGQQARLGANFEDLKSKIGAVFIPALTGAIQVINSSVIPGFKRLWDNLAPQRETFAKVGVAVATIIAQIRNGDWAGAWSGIKRGATAGLQATEDASREFLLNRLLPKITGWLGRVREGWQNKWANFWRDPAKAYNRTADETDRFGNGLVETTISYSAAAAISLKKNMDKMPGFARSAGARTIVMLMQAIRGLPALAGAIAARTTVNFIQFLQKMAPAAANIIGNVVRSITSGLAGVATAAYQAGANIVSSLASGMISRLASVAAAAARDAQSIRDHFPGSPVKTGPLTAWNNGATGKKLVALLTQGMDPGPVAAAASRLAASATLGVPRVALTGGSPSGAAAGGGVAFNAPVYTYNPNQLAERVRKAQTRALQAAMVPA